MRCRVVPGLVLAALVALAGCDSNSGPPGVLSGTVTVSAQQTLGAAVLEITGSGIQGFQGQGGSVVYGALLDAQSKRYRMVVVGTGPLSFGVKVDNVKSRRPAVQVVSAVDDQNKNLSTSAVKVTLSN
jgi:hypothetical protein